ncbi:MAG: prolipoprotein diacylglyceryl transferase [bacterium]|nr:prolipoprotein diacylglyceryl transferase [bacterium]
MFPIALTFGPITVYSYGLCLAMAFGAATILSGWRARYIPEVTRSDVMDLAIIIITSSVVGARMLYVIIDWEYYWAQPLKIFNLPEGGLVFYGGLIGAIIGAVLFSLFRGRNFWVIADMISPGILLGQAIGRVGCFLNGCCYGQHTESWVGILFKGSAGLVPRHPTQLYSAAANFLLVFVLLAIDRWFKRFPSSTFAWYVILYGTFRFLIEFVRDDDRGGFFLGMITISQLISLAGIALGLVLIIRGLSRLRNEEKKPL